MTFALSSMKPVGRWALAVAVLRLCHGMTSIKELFLSACCKLQCSFELSYLSLLANLWQTSPQLYFFIRRSLDFVLSSPTAYLMIDCKQKVSQDDTSSWCEQSWGTCTRDNVAVKKIPALDTESEQKDLETRMCFREVPRSECSSDETQLDGAILIRDE